MAPVSNAEEHIQEALQRIGIRVIKLRQFAHYRLHNPVLRASEFFRKPKSALRQPGGELKLSPPLPIQRQRLCNPVQ